MGLISRTNWMKSLPNNLTIVGRDGRTHLITAIAQKHLDGTVNLITLRLTEADCIVLGILD